MWMTLSKPPETDQRRLEALESLSAISAAPLGKRTASLDQRTSVAVAVPACNERERIARCIATLDAAAARVAAHATVTVLVLANNCRDKTALAARRCKPQALRLIVEEITLPPPLAHAGGARREALDRAVALLPSNGMLMTTDADSAVAPDWIAANLAALVSVDAVAGVVAFDPTTRAALPRLPGRDLEWRLAELQARLGTLIDPLPHDPWPNHIWAWGASLALTVSAYRAVGGLPAVPLAEDRALAAALERADLRLRRSHAPVVYTSARVDGRAPGGFADLLRSYATDPAAPCDTALEPVAVLLWRLRWRAKLRRVHACDGAAEAATAARPLAGAVAPASGFGAFWASVESTAPSLRRHRLLPSQLPAEVALAERLVTAWLRVGAAHQDDIPPSALAA